MGFVEGVGDTLEISLLDCLVGEIGLHLEGLSAVAHVGRTEKARFPLVALFLMQPVRAERA